MERKLHKAILAKADLGKSEKTIARELGFSSMASYLFAKSAETCYPTFALRDDKNTQEDEKGVVKLLRDAANDLSKFYASTANKEQSNDTEFICKPT
jgi:hypothetical protein